MVGHMDMRDIPLDILDQVKALDIEEYLEYLKLYKRNGNTHTNTEQGIARKLASLKHSIIIILKGINSYESGSPCFCSETS